MAPDGENFRGVNATYTLSIISRHTLDGLITNVGYNTRIAAFYILLPALVKAYKKLDKSDSLYERLAGPIASLDSWLYYASETSIAATLAIEWAEKVSPSIQRVYIDQGEADQVEKTKQFAAMASPAQLLQPLDQVVKELTAKFGKWQIPWGDLNRFQRTTGGLVETYDDNKPSLPVPFLSSTWGMLPSFNSRYFPGTKKRYGVGGNSFICAVEFGKKIKAKSLLAGGETANPDSKHFFDQGLMYTKGQFKEVLFYKEDVLKHVEKTYHPGE